MHKIGLDILKKNPKLLHIKEILSTFAIEMDKQTYFNSFYDTQTLSKIATIIV